VFLSEPAETPADLRFWLFGVHVRVHPFFWIVAAVLGWGIVGEYDNTRIGLIYLVVWVACVFVSVLIHELGHVFMGQVFGSHGHIVLHSFGGLAIGSNALNRGWQRFFVSFAGPLIQFVLFGVALVVWLALFWGPAPQDPPAWYEPVQRTLGFLLEINLFWPILNLLPIWPLDGGQMAREVFVGVAPRNGLFLSFGLSALLAGVLAVHCLMVRYNPTAWPLTPYLPFGGIYMAIFFGLFCAQSLVALQAENARRQTYGDDQFPWER
jgi:Zn-dependent protease